MGPFGAPCRPMGLDMLAESMNYLTDISLPSDSREIVARLGAACATDGFRSTTDKLRSEQNPARKRGDN